MQPSGDILVGELLGLLNVAQTVGIGVLVYWMTKRNGST